LTGSRKLGTVDETLLGKGFLMRVQHWIAALVALSVLLLGRQSGFAQNPPQGYPTLLPASQLTTAPANANPVMTGEAGSANPYAAQTPSPTANFSNSLSEPEYGSGYPAVTPPVPPQFGADVYGSTVQPYPQVSPFDFSFGNYFNWGGIWKHNENTQPRQFYFKADALFIQTIRPEGVFGDPNAESYARQVRDFLNGASTSSSSSSTTSGSAQPNGTTSSTTSSTTSGEGSVSQVLTDQGFIVDTPYYEYTQFNYYNAVNLSTFSPLETEGGKFTLGYWNPDESGLAAYFWFGGVADNQFNALNYATRQPTDLKGLYQIIRFLQNPTSQYSGNLATMGPEIPGFNYRKFTPDLVLQANLFNLRGLPVADNTVTGQTIPYDIYFGIDTTSQQLGTGLDYYLTPLFDSKWFTVAPSVGFKYLNIREGLSFLGIDSGMLYGPSSSTSSSSTSTTTTTSTSTSTTSGIAASPDRDFKAQPLPSGNNTELATDPIVDPAGTLSSVSSSSSSSSSTSSTTSGALFSLPSPFALLPATINIGTMSNVFGPNVGLRYQMGGSHLRLIGETKVGVMADFESISLSGDNIGNTTRVNGNSVTWPAELTDGTVLPSPRPENNQDLIIPTPANPNPNAFSSSQSHSHVSPMVEQSLTAECQLFQYIPVLRNLWGFRNATFSAGLDFIYIGDLIQTNNSVIYQGDPMAGMFPVISVQHDGWWTINYSTGLSWDF
jgi:hypothetical protein